MSQTFILNGAKALIRVSQNTLGEQFHQKLQEYQHLPNAIVDVETNVVVSYTSLFNQTCSLAINLQRQGADEHTVVGILSVNCLDFIVPVISGLYLGLPVTTFNPTFTIGEFLHAASISKPNILFVSKETLKLAMEAHSKLNCIKKIILIDTLEKKGSLTTLNEWTHNCSEEEIKNFRPLSFDISDRVAFIIYSSGTTGFPKGVILTHKNYNTTMALIRDSRFLFQFTPGEGGAIALLPFYHAYGLYVIIYNALHGCSLILHKKFIPTQFLQSIQDYKVQTLALVPTLANFIAKSDLIKQYDLSSIKDIICASASLSKEVENLIRAKLRNLMVMRQAYGMTETTMVATMNPVDRAKDGSSGILVPHIQGKVVDPETGKLLGPMQSGELCFKGDAIMKGYADNKKATDEIIDENGWLHSGDIGYYDEEGYLFISGRLKELIKYKATQVPPAEIEGLLINHPKILEAAVIGIPDEIAGELPMAFIVKEPNVKLTEIEVQNYVKENLSSAKWLRGGVKMIDELPKNPVGKVLKRELMKLVYLPKPKL